MSIITDVAIANGPTVAALFALWLQQRKQNQALLILAENVDGVSASKINDEASLSFAD